MDDPMTPEEKHEFRVIWKRVRERVDVGSDVNGAPIVHERGKAQKSKVFQTLVGAGDFLQRLECAEDDEGIFGEVEYSRIQQRRVGAWEECSQ